MFEEPMCPTVNKTDWDAIEQHDELVFPLNKRVVVEYVPGESGERELHLHYRSIEVVFDEPELFEFGETLPKHARFVAENATRWGSDLSWPRVRELLEQLLQTGVLKRADSQSATDTATRGAVPSPLPAAESTTPRSWRECEALTRELTGRTVELGYLELFVPLYRVMHCALDREGRQVGEANVFPPSLRLAIETEWRTCQYPGSRYQDEYPLNVSALRSMNAHWKPLLRLVSQVRAHYLARVGQSAAGAWSVGDLYCLSMLSMGIAAYALMNEQAPTANGELHPVLSSLVRISDGVRIAADEMLFSRYEGVPFKPDTLVTAKELFAFCERNDLMLSRYGVCAAPRAMIESYLSVLFEGAEQEEEPDAELQALTVQLVAAFDYGLHALRSYALVFSTWVFVCETHERLRTQLAEAEPSALPLLGELRARLDSEWSRFIASGLGSPDARLERIEIYGDVYARSGRALGLPDDEPSLAQRSALNAAETSVAAHRLAAAIEQHLSSAGFAPASAEALAHTLSAQLLREQAHVRVAEALQAEVNRALGRAAPSQPLTAAILLLHHQLRRPDIRLPRCIDAFEDALSIQFEVTKSSTDIKSVEACMLHVQHKQKEVRT